MERGIRIMNQKMNTLGDKNERRVRITSCRHVLSMCGIGFD